MTRTIVVGVGNPLLGDDGIGIVVAKEFKKEAKQLDIVIEEAYTGGMNLLDIILGYDRAILVDAVSIPSIEAGSVMVLDPMTMPSAHSTNPHDLSFPEAVEVARRTGERRVPSEIVLIAVNIIPQFDFSSELSEKVREAIPLAMLKVRDLLKND